MSTIQATAARIAADLSRLHREAEQARLPVLAYLIHCAQMEAEQAGGVRFWPNRDLN